MASPDQKNITTEKQSEHRETGRLFPIDELLLLEILTYLVETPPFKGILYSKGMTVEELVDEIDREAIDEELDYGSTITGYDWKNLLMAICRHDTLLNTRIADTYIDRAYGGGGGIAAVFISEDIGEAVIAFRGTALNEWQDDFQGSSLTDTLQQLNALEWYRAIYRNLDLKRYHVTLIGHSKGGNKAKYVTILDDTPDRCISFDGQGFSDNFITHYQDRILLRRDRIQNHNVDYDYVNILLNDVGERFYYTGYDYGRSGFLESHAPNTFFDFGENGEYSMTLSPTGQSREMQLADQFFNSYIRSMPSEKEKAEASKLVGLMIERGFEVKAGEDSTDNYLNFICDMVADPVYSDNVAFLLSFMIKYERLHPGFVATLEGMLTRFGMDGLLVYLDYARTIMNWKGLDAILGMTNFLIGHVPESLAKRLQSLMKKRFNVDLSLPQIRGLLTVVQLTHQTMDRLEIVDDGADLVPEELNEDGSQRTAAAPSGLSSIEEDLSGMPEQMNIVVLAGGLSAERNVSLRTGRAVTDTLKLMGHNVILLDTYLGCSLTPLQLKEPFAHTDEISLKPTIAADILPDLWAVRKRRTGRDQSLIGPNVLELCRAADLVFIALHSAFGESGRLQAMLDIYGVDYTGCSYQAVTLSMNKNASKQIFRGAGILTPDWALLKRQNGANIGLPDGLEFPVVVKPCRGGSAIGVSLASDHASFVSALTNAFKWEDEVLVEDFIPGREFSVSFLDGQPLPVLEIMVPSGLYDYRHRFFLESPAKHCPASLPIELAEKLQQIALEAAQCLDVKVYGRVDFKLDRDGRIWCVECDALPDLTRKSRFAQQAEAAGLDSEMMCRRIIEASFRK